MPINGLENIFKMHVLFSKRHIQIAEFLFSKTNIGGQTSYKHAPILLTLGKRLSSSISEIIFMGFCPSISKMSWLSTNVMCCHLIPS